MNDEMNGQDMIEETQNVVEWLRNLKEKDTANGRLWAIAVTRAEELHAWVRYVESKTGGTP